MNYGFLKRQGGEILNFLNWFYLTQFKVHLLVLI